MNDEPEIDALEARVLRAWRARGAETPDASVRDAVAEPEARVRDAVMRSVRARAAANAAAADSAPPALERLVRRALLAASVAAAAAALAGGGRLAGLDPGHALERALSSDPAAWLPVVLVLR